MLTTRNVIVAIVAVALLSVASALVSLLWAGQTQSTLGRDSYGTRTEGYRAVHDLLGALDFETERTLIPSLPDNALDTSYVLWNPRDRVVQTEPAYLEALSQWVRQGGYLVVTPSAASEHPDDAKCPRCGSKKKRCTCIPVSLLGELGLMGVAIKEIELQSTSDDDPQEDSVSENLREEIRDIFRVKKRPSAVYDIACSGEWEHLNALASQIELPTDKSWEIKYGDLEPVAKISVDRAGEDTAGTLAALFALGKGQVAVISNPYLASNANLSEADNSVLLTHLLTDMRPTVVFDEFYHGLTVRGNALWLLSKPPYAVFTVSILAVIGLWIWRQAIFLGPSRQETPVSRRSLGEYLEAMSRFLLKGRDSSKYVLREVRDGVLWHFCKTLGLPPQQQNVDLVLGLLSRRIPQKATQLEAALKYADGVLKNPRAPKHEILLATRKVSDCLST